MAGLAEVFGRDRYLLLRSLLSEPDLSLMYCYARRVAALVVKPSGDDQVADTPCSYGDPMMDGLLISLLPKIEHACGLRLFPTYSYFRVYKDGDTLKRHTDRPSCEISVTLCLGYEAPRAWPIWIEGSGGVTSFNLEAGDAVLYRGMESPHWRAAFEGRHLAQVFLHYVDQHGPHAEWKFDKRTSLTDLRTLIRSFRGRGGPP